MNRYSEADIARLEAEDLTDPKVCSALLDAYYQDDTPRDDESFVIARGLNVFVPKSKLKEQLAELEALENPTARNRGDRLRILSRLAMLRKMESR